MYYKDKLQISLILWLSLYFLFHTNIYSRKMNSIKFRLNPTWPSWGG